jgi:ribosomal protein S18 acetylase RimI-like enzyme
MDFEKLDNPVWWALSETHEQFSIRYNGIRFYHPDYCPFGAFTKTENLASATNEYSKLCNNFFLVGQEPSFTMESPVASELVCNQMIVHSRIDHGINEVIEKLSDKHADQLFELVNLVQPGYFRIKTSMLGNYYGIFKDNELVAVTGERMAMKGFTEVSAVVTHPDHTGKGYAKQLVTHTVNEIFNQNTIPFLHVTVTNTAAIKLYEKIGFVTRRKMSFWHFAM